MITFLWAQSQNGVIGQDGKLPWNLSEEMQHFKNYTLNKTVLMGWNTWNSLTVKPLPNRKNLVATTKKEISYPNTKFSDNLQQMIEPFKNSDEELVVIGGKKIFDSLMAEADKLVISFINQDYQGDTMAPNWNKDNFKLIGEEKYSNFIVFTYQRIKKD